MVAGTPGPVAIMSCIVQGNGSVTTRRATSPSQSAAEPEIITPTSAQVPRIVPSRQRRGPQGPPDLRRLRLTLPFTTDGLVCPPGPLRGRVYREPGDDLGVVAKRAADHHPGLAHPRARNDRSCRGGQCQGCPWGRLVGLISPTMADVRARASFLQAQCKEMLRDPDIAQTRQTRCLGYIRCRASMNGYLAHTVSPTFPTPNAFIRARISGVAPASIFLGHLRGRRPCPDNDPPLDDVAWDARDVMSHLRATADQAAHA